MKIDMTKVNEGLQLATVALPQLAAAYAAYKVIWMTVNPGKTEDDYVAALGDASKANVSAADAILAADGYVQDGLGGWKKPSAPASS